MPNEVYSWGIVVAQLLAALSAFSSGKVMMSSQYEREKKEWADRLAEQRVETKVQEARADRLLDHLMRLTHVAEAKVEDLIADNRNTKGKGA